ncbi:hypothetical protein YC2023_057870 [Brassica napus]
MWSHPIDSTTLIHSSLTSTHHKSLSYVIIHIKPPQSYPNSVPINTNQLAVSTAQPATSITTQGSSTSGVTNVYKLSKAELKRYQLTRIEEPEEHIDPDYLRYLKAIGAYDSSQPQSERGKGQGREHIDPDYLLYLRAIGAYDYIQQQPKRGNGRGREGRR